MKKKDNEKYVKIIKAAIEIILDEGAATLSTTKVAKKVAISQSNIYIYFKNKDDLLKQIYLLEIKCYQDLIENIVKNNDSTLEKIKQYIKALYDVSIKNPDSMFIIEQIKQIPNSPIDITDPNFIGFEGNPIFDLLKKGISEGILKDIDPTIYLSMIFNTIRMNSINTKRNRSTASLDSIMSLLLEGMAKNTTTD